MKKNYIFTIVVILLISCKMVRDTEGRDIKSKYNDDNIIFKTNNKFTYNAYRIKDKDTLDIYDINYLGDTLIIEKVALTILPGKFFSQTKIKWEYLDKNDSVVRKPITGVVENSKTIWLHPPRSGIPFIYTESAPFPEITYPLDSMSNWKGGLMGLKGYESIGLEGKVSFQYYVSKRRDIKTDYKLFKDCYVINSRGTSCIGISTHNYYFDEKYGFVYSEYNFPTGEKLVLSLTDFKEGMAISN